MTVIILALIRTHERRFIKYPCMRNGCNKLRGACALWLGRSPGRAFAVRCVPAALEVPSQTPLQPEYLSGSSAEVPVVWLGFLFVCLFGFLKNFFSSFFFFKTRHDLENFVSRREDLLLFSARFVPGDPLVSPSGKKIKEKQKKKRTLVEKRGLWAQVACTSGPLLSPLQFSNFFPSCLWKKDAKVRFGESPALPAAVRAMRCPGGPVSSRQLEAPSLLEQLRNR